MRVVSGYPLLTKACGFWGLLPAWRPFKILPEHGKTIPTITGVYNHPVFTCSIANIFEVPSSQRRVGFLPQVIFCVQNFPVEKHHSNLLYRIPSRVSGLQLGVENGLCIGRTRGSFALILAGYDDVRLWSSFSKTAAR